MKIKSLKNKIVVSIMGIIVFFGSLAAFWIGYSSKNALVNKKVEEISMALSYEADRASMIINEAQKDVSMISQESLIIDQMDNLDNVGSNEKLKNFLARSGMNSSYAYLGLLDKDGKVVAASDEKYVNNNFGFRKYFSIALQKDSAIETAINIVTGEQEFFFSHSIKNQQGIVLGVAVVSLSTQSFFGKLFATTGLMDGHVHIFLDEYGIVLESNKVEYKNKSLGILSSDTAAKIVADKQYADLAIKPLQYDVIMKDLANIAKIKTYRIFDDVDRIDEIVGVARVGSFPFFIAMEVKSSSYMGEISKIYYTMGFSVLAAAMIAAVMIYFLLEHFLLPLKQLRRAAEKIGAKNLDYNVEIKTGDDFEDLGNAYNTMTRAVKKSIADIDKKVKEQTIDIVKKQRELENQKKAVLNILEDMSEEKAYSEKLANDLEKFELAIENVNDQVVITDEKGIIVHANPATLKISGYTQKEVIGKTPAIWGGRMSKQYYKALWEEISFKKKTYSGELYNKKKNGKSYLANVSIFPILDKKEDIRFFVSVERDISKEREAQKRIIKDAEDLKISKELIESQKERAEGILRFLKSISEGVVAVDLVGKIIFFNEAAETLTGFSGKKAMGMATVNVLKFYKESNPDLQFEVFSGVIKGTNDLKKNAESFLLENIRTNIKIPVSFSMSPIIDTNNEKQGYIMIIHDVTEQRELEKNKDNFLSVAAHQLRTPLSGIRWSLEMLLDGDAGELPTEAKEVVNNINENNQRLVVLVNDLLNVSRINLGKTTEESKITNVCGSVSAVVKSMEGFSLKNKVNIIFAESKNCGLSVMISPKRFFESIENILSNAIKYTTENGNVTIIIAKVKNKVRIAISDTGIGIPENQQKNMFSKFFRAENAILKDPEGSGLGLSVVKSFIEEVGGEITFKSVEGKGTTFFITLPLCEEEVKLV